MLRSHKIKLQPTKAQEEYFSKACGTARFAFNWALSEWKKEYEAGGKPSEMSLRKKLNSIKAAEFPWMSEVTKCAPQQAIKNLGSAFEHFFRRVKSGGKPGYPRFKCKGKHDSFRADNGPRDSTKHAVECKNKTIKLPRCGVVKMRENLRFGGRVLSATVSKMADGWYVAVKVETNDITSGKLGGGVVGVDLGVKNLAVLSTGGVIPALKPNRLAHNRLARLSRSLSRKKKGGSNYAKAKNKLGKLHKRIADIRKDALHKLTHKLATEFDTVAIEDLNVQGMLKNSFLARSLSDSGFYEFRRQLEYKTAMTGAKLFIVDRFYPSSKTCSACGQIHEMKLSERTMVCDCGNVMDRDLNAAINLKNKAVSSTVSACEESGSGCGGNIPTKLVSVKQEEGKPSERPMGD